MSQYLKILKKYWGYPAFRPLQEDIIRAVADNKQDTLGLLPTGGGKSIIFQVPALAQEGTCLVVTPLIALMKDQVYNLNRRGIHAAAIHSGLHGAEIKRLFDSAQAGYYKFLYVSPERLGTESFRERAKGLPINLVAVDEAHCISQWGYDFRPSYLNIKQIRELLDPMPPVLALTATATPKVVDDIQDKLGFSQHNVFKKSFYRENLIYLVRQVEDKYGYLLKIINKIPASGVVYVRNRKGTKAIAELLQRNNISATFYHAGLPSETKDARQEAWQQGKIKVMVATNAFGMGIDKPDVRFVAHMDLPDSLEAYFQEAGRAGRDGKKAYAILLYNDSDSKKLHQAIDRAFPPKEQVKSLYNALGNYYQLPVGSGKGRSFAFQMADFASHFRFSFMTIHSSLTILQRAGFLEYSERLTNPSRLMFRVQRDQLYEFQVKNAHFDRFIKLILRTYPGLFSDYVKIDEGLLAKKAAASRDLVYDYLKTLARLKIIHYIPQIDLPIITFLTARVSEQNIELTREHYQDRKDLAMQRVHSVVSYATNTKQCRSQQLLAYFGETRAAACGRCDVCRANKEHELSASLLQAIQKETLSLVSDGQQVGLKELIYQLTQGSVVQRQKALRWMIDKQLLTVDSLRRVSKAT